MTVLSDRAIKRLCDPRMLTRDEHPMIDPFIDQQVRKTEHGDKVISYGLSSAGYDVRLGPHFKMARPRSEVRRNLGGIEPALDPKAISNGGVDYFQSFETALPFVLQPGEAVLGATVERFRMPRDVIGKCYNKSTYARCFLIVGVTPLEPGWEGFLTIEISNTAPVPVVIYPMEGICQITFERLDQGCEVSYDDRAGKYQNAPGVQVARV